MQLHSVSQVAIGVRDMEEALLSDAGGNYVQLDQHVMGWAGMREADTLVARTPRPMPRGGARLHECSVELEVPFHDVDAMRLVWHGHYFKYLERARTELLRSRGLDVSDLVSLELAFVVIDSGCRYIAPLRYADRMRVSAWFRDISHRLYVAYEIQNLSRETHAARAYTVLATTSFEGRVFHRTPKAILERLGPAPESTREHGG